jgi:hypothetical protein
MISFRFGFWGQACQWIAWPFLTKIDGSWTPVPTIVMKEAVRIHRRETKAHMDSLPHSREYEI